MALLNQDVEPLIVGESKTYNGDWRRVLAGIAGAPTITLSAWVVVAGGAGLTIVGSAINVDGDITSVTLQGATAGVVYTLRNTVTLSDSQVLYKYGVVEVVDESTILH